MQLTQSERYGAWGLDDVAQGRLAVLGDRLLAAEFNVTAVTEPVEIERLHFLDSLSLLAAREVRSCARPVDLGSGAGLPALVLALALPAAVVTAIESQQKKCRFIRETAEAMGLGNVEVRCARAEEYGQGSGREAHDVALSRALAALPVVAEYSLPLLQNGGTMVAMKGDISNQERIQAQKALDILGGGRLESLRLDPFPGAENRWVHLARKERATPQGYPRRAGIPAKKPLGA